MRYGGADYDTGSGSIRQACLAEDEVDGFGVSDTPKPQALDVRFLIVLFNCRLARCRAPDRTGGTDMGTSITVRNIDPGDKSWLQREARQTGVSTEEFVRRLIHEKRNKTERRPKPSEAFARHFGEDHGVELSPLVRCGYKPLASSGEEQT